MHTKLTTTMAASGNLLKTGMGLLLLLLSHCVLQAAPYVTLVWNPNAEADITGYNVYFGSVSGTYTNKISVGKVTTNKVYGLSYGATYFFAVTALNTSGGESDFSNEYRYSVPAATTLDLWKNSNFTAADLSDPTKESTVWGDTVDPDNDGHDNLMELALGLDPNKTEPTTDAISTGISDVSGSKYATITFRRRKTEPLLQYVPEVSADGQTWSSGAGALTQLSATSVDTTFELATYQDLTPVDAANPRFIRLRIVK